MEENRPKTKSFEDLLAWQKAHAFVLSIYEVTKHFPKDELFGLMSQLKKLPQILPRVIRNKVKKKKYISLILHKGHWKNVDII